MKRKILNVLSKVEIVFAIITILLTIYYLTYSFSYLMEYYTHETNYIKIVMIIRIVLLIILIIHCINVIKHALKIPKLDPEKHTKEIKKNKIFMSIALVVSFILQIINISSLYSNILLISLVVIESIVLIFYIERKWLRRTIEVLLGLYILLIIFLFSYSYLFCHYFEIPTIFKGTSTKPLNNIETQIFKMTADSEFYHASFYDKLDEKEYDMIPIPGILYSQTVTKENHNRIETCTSMTPQGMAITDKYVYVSSYCHSHVHNSVIYQIDKETKKLIKTIVLPDASHVGGLAYDDKNNVLWVATKKKNEKGVATVSCLTQDVIDNYNFKVSKEPIRYYKTFETAFTENSFLTYHDGYLYTGLFKYNDDDQSMIAKIKIKKNGTSIDKEPIKYYYIPGKIQSAAFIDDKLVLSKSFALNSSEILIYKFDENKIDYYSTEPDNYIITPQMLEQIYPYKDNIYLVFESAAFSYRYTSGISMDYIVSINKKFL